MRAAAQLALVNVGSTNVGVVLDLQVSGNYAYLANGGTGMRICDVSDPAHPVSITTIASHGYARSITLSGSRAILACDNVLDVYDVSNPTNPVSLGSTNFTGSPGALAVSNNYVYVPLPSNLNIYDISSPLNPTLVGSATGGGSASIVLANGFAYVSRPNTSHTLYVYDVHNPYAPTNVYSSTNGYIFGLAMASNHLFAAAESFAIAGGVNGILTFDVSNPTNPVYQKTTGGTISSGARLVAANNYLYLLDYTRGLVAYDASNPTNLVSLGGSKTTGTAYSLAVVGAYAYVGGSDGLHISKIMPRLDASIPNPGFLHLSWPAPVAFAVQSTDDLASTNWQTLANIPTAIGTHAQLDLPKPAANTFYRLITR